MKITILTLFEKCILEYINSSIIKNAIKNNKVEINVVDFRKYSLDKHKKVDDYQYGGGAGMVLMLQPIVDAINALKTKNTHIILLSPQGIKYNQEKAKSFAKKNQDLIIICGHYEGFDERIIHYVDEVVSIGDYILTGGELAAMVITDSVVRLIDNVISKDSLINETFENNLLDYPVYTKPINYDGHIVPKILLSGDHDKITEFKTKQQQLKTKINNFEQYRNYLKKEDKNAY